MIPDLEAPETQIAQDFMTRKGYSGLVPFEVEEVDAEVALYYFYYRLPEGELELEVSWNPKTGMWDTMVTAFLVSE